MRSRECDARALFLALTEPQQRAAIAAARAYAAHVRRKPGYAFALQTWLKQTDFNASQRPPTAPDGASNRVFVRDGSPEWDAWADHYRRQGKPMLTPIWSELNRASGWNFPAALPPAATAAA